MRSFVAKGQEVLANLANTFFGPIATPAYASLA